MTKKKITIIGPPAFGYTKYIAEALKEKGNIQVNLLYIDRSSFKYRNVIHKIINFLSKTFLNLNLKIKYQDDLVINALNKLEKQDYIFTIRPDLLSNNALKVIKQSTYNNLAFYYDSITRFPRKAEIVKYFDKIFSYDKADIAVHGFNFLTNYIYEESRIENFDYLFFNISSYDFRYNSLKNLAKYINTNGWSSKILVHHPDLNTNKSKYIEVINKTKSVNEINTLMQRSKIIVEIQRNDQIGLSFRIFEALGHSKKLITTNKDIVNYDFYNPQNILVIDENSIKIPEDFVTAPYVTIEDSILNKYKVSNWVKPIFNLQ